MLQLIEAGKFDMEGMLNGIRPVCNVREREIIDRILNFFNMKRMFEMYNKMMEMMKNMQDFGGFDFSGFENSGNDAENVTSNFESPNYESIFNHMKNSSPQEKPETSFSEEYHQTDATFPDPEKDTSPQTGTGYKVNEKMMNMLKAMVPPEQMSTFENLSMLLNTMSYDNNSKTELNKEHNDGDS
jgi:hypothetical protein